MPPSVITTLNQLEHVSACYRQRIVPDDVEVRFFEEDEYGMVTWEAFGQFVHSDVHRQVY